MSGCDLHTLGTLPHHLYYYMLPSCMFQAIYLVLRQVLEKSRSKFVRATIRAIMPKLSLRSWSSEAHSEVNAGIYPVVHNISKLMATVRFIDLAQAAFSLIVSSRLAQIWNFIGCWILILIRTIHQYRIRISTLIKVVSNLNLTLGCYNTSTTI